MKKDQLAFLFGGLAFGFLLGFALFRAIETRPGKVAADAGGGEIPSPMGPAAPTQIAMSPQAGGGGAPMMAEINALKEHLQKEPTSVEAWTRLANIYQDAGLWAQAIDFYKRAVELSPNNANLLTDMAICYQELTQFDTALELLERAQKADPSNWQSLYNIVVVAGLRMGQIDRADAALAKLQQLNPGAPNLDRLRAELHKVR